MTKEIDFYTAQESMRQDVANPSSHLTLKMLATEWDHFKALCKENNFFAPEVVIKKETDYIEVDICVGKYSQKPEATQPGFNRATVYDFVNLLSQLGYYLSDEGLRKWKGESDSFNKSPRTVNEHSHAIMVSNDDFNIYCNIRQAILIANQKPHSLTKIDAFIAECIELMKNDTEIRAIGSYSKALNIKFKELYNKLSEEESYDFYNAISTQCKSVKNVNALLIMQHNKESIAERLKPHKKMNTFALLGMFYIFLYSRLIVGGEESNDEGEKKNKVNPFLRALRVTGGILLLLMSLPLALGYGLFMGISLIFSTLSDLLIDKKSDATKQAFENFLKTQEGGLFHTDFMQMVCRKIFLNNMKLDINNMTEADMLVEYAKITDRQNELDVFYDSKWNNLSFDNSVLQQRQMNVVIRWLGMGSVAICKAFQKAFTFLADIIAFPLYKPMEMMLQKTSDDYEHQAESITENLVAPVNGRKTTSEKHDTPELVVLERLFRQPESKDQQATSKTATAKSRKM